MAAQPQSILGVRWNNYNFPTGKLVMSVSEFKEQFLYGIPLCNTVTGQTISDETIRQKLYAYQDLFENEFMLKLFKQQITESKDFIMEEYRNWGFIKTSWQISNICSLVGQFNQVPVITYPLQWLTTRQGDTANGNEGIWRNLYIVPNGGATATFNSLSVVYTQIYGLYGMDKIPNWWKITYITGYDVIPPSIINIIGIAVAMEILALAEKVVAQQGTGLFGIASSSLSFDGLSQSASKMNGGNIFQQQIKQYAEMLKQQLPIMRNMYGGIAFDVF